MNLNKNIVLLGMMGSGKSTIGYLLSKSINLSISTCLRLVDLDKRYPIVDFPDPIMPIKTIFLFKFIILY